MDCDCDSRLCNECLYKLKIDYFNAIRRLVATGADAELRRFGWVPTGTIERAPGVVASLYRRASSASAG